jgi:hypothetical protein
MLAAVAVYAGAGFLLVPAVLRQQLPELGRSVLQRQASVSEVRFNPFTLRLQASGLRLAEADGAPLLDVGQLVVEMQWRSLLRRAWSFAEIRIGQPQAQLVIAPDGRFNLADLVASLRKPDAQPSADASLPRLIIERFALEQGRVVITDRQAGYTNRLEPIDLALHQFSTLPDRTDSHTFTAESARGGRLRWRGSMSLNPIRAQGEVTLEDLPLAGIAPYLQGYVQAAPRSGTLSAALPYRVSYAGGRLEAQLSGARLALRGLAVGRTGADQPFAALDSLDVGPVDADYAQRTVRVAEVRASGGHLHVRRDAQGAIDLANLMVARAAGGTAAGAAPQAPPASGTPATPGAPWKVALERIQLEGFGLAANDEGANPPLRAQVKAVQLQSRVFLEQAASGLQVRAEDTAITLDEVALASGAQTPLRLASLGVAGASFDLAQRRIGIEQLKASGGELQLARDAQGRLNLLAMLPSEAAAPTPAAAPARASSPPRPQADPWLVATQRVELQDLRAALADEATGIRLHVEDLDAQAEGAGSDLARPVRFKAALRLREGGRLSAQGRVVPASGALDSQVQVAGLALAPVQPLLARHVRLTLRKGEVAAQGRLRLAAAGAAGPRVQYAGSFGVAGLALHEDDGELFAGWREVAADQLTVNVGPNLLDIPELRVVDANAKLIIEEDRSLNAARLLVRAPAAPQAAPRATGAPAAAKPTPAATPAAAAGGEEPAEPFPVRIGSVRVRNATLDFADLSLRPQFGARIQELSGTVQGLRTDRASRSQLELDGRVGEFGSARVRGGLNPFAPSENTDVAVAFRNVDLIPVSPYSMKFAGYRIAGGKLSLDLQYKVAARKLQGDNRVVLDQLTLGERVESPDALKLPLELAIAILKDSDGRIDLQLPVSGDLDDPQFSYGAIVWKAIGNLLTRIVTAPFRALGGLLGLGSGEQLEAIEFDPGSAALRPPEREKLTRVAQVLQKRPQLKLAVPGHYDEAADGAALRGLAVRAEVARRAGITVREGELPAPVNLGDRSMRKAVRELYAARFGQAALDERKAAAEAPTRSGAAPALPIWQRAGQLLQGEPQVADSGGFYRGLLERLEREQALAPDALARLGTARAAAVLGQLQQGGVDGARARATAPAQGSGGPQAVKLTLGLGLN